MITTKLLSRDALASDYSDESSTKKVCTTKYFALSY